METDILQKYHATDNGFAIQTYQDISGYLRANERMYTENQLNKNAASWRKDNTMGWHKASIPMSIIHVWMKEFQKERQQELPPRITDPEFKTFMFKKLRDSENRKFRVDGRTD